MDRASAYENVGFAPYARVPFDREWARDKTHPKAQDEAKVVLDGVGYDEFELWANSAMEEEEDWDDEVHAVHSLLEEAEPLDDEARIMRLQITSYEACHYMFPDSIFALIGSIGRGAADRELRTGCGAHYGPLMDDARRERIETYASVLEGWVEGRDLDASLREHPGHTDDVRHIYDMLGERTHKKTLYVRRLALVIGLMAQGGEGYRYYSDQCGYPYAAEIDREILTAEGVDPARAEEVIDRGLNVTKGEAEDRFHELLRDVNPLLERICSHYAVPCRIHLFHHFDIWISSVGCGSWRGAMPPTGENRRRIESTVAHLVCALDGWLAGLDPEEAAKPWPEALDTCREVQDFLGDPRPARRYLTSMLWKRLKSQKGRGLIEAHPEAFSARWVS